MTRGWADQVVTVEGVQKPLDHWTDCDRQNIDESGRGKRSQKHLALADVRPTGRKDRIFVGRGAIARNKAQFNPARARKSRSPAPGNACFCFRRGV